MTPIIKIKVTPKNTLKGKMDVRFPANVVGNNFITIERANGTYTFGVDYSILTPGPIADPNTAFVAIEDQTSGVYKTVSLASLLTSGLDSDLQAIAALTGTGILVRTAANTWAFRNVVGGFAITVTNGDGVAGNISVAVTDPELVALAGLVSAADRLPYFTGSGTASLATFTAFGRSLVDDADATAGRATLGVVIGTDVQAFDSDLAAVAALATNGLLARTGTGTAATRTLQSASAGLTWTNGDGVSGNPVPVFANDLGALEALASTGIARRTGTDAWSVGTAVANSELATAGAYTLKGNATGSTATPTDFTFASLTQKASPAGTDEVLIADNAAAGAFKRTPISAVASAGSVGSVNGKTGAVVVSVTKQVFTAGGTYTPSAGMIYAIIECVGGGGGGGGSVGAASAIYTAGGGGSGGYSRSVLSAATIGASQAVTIGSGGAAGSGTTPTNGGAGSATSVGTIVVANGGSGGLFASAAQVGVGGSGAVTTSAAGDLQAAGTPGSNGFYNSVNANITSASGAGGSSFFGGGAPSMNGNTNGAPGRAYGSGGSGAASGSAANFNGGAGSSGVVFITEYCVN